MNKSDIMKAAEEAAEWLEVYKNSDGASLYKYAERVSQSLCKAAELLKQVEVLPEGSEPMVGDWVSLRPDNPNAAPQKYYGKENVADQDHMNQFKILIRNSKPVIIDKEGV